MKQSYFATQPVEPVNPEEENHTESGHGNPPPPTDVE